MQEKTFNKNRREEKPKLSIQNKTKQKNNPQPHPTNKITQMQPSQVKRKLKMKIFSGAGEIRSKLSIINRK